MKKIVACILSMILLFSVSSAEIAFDNHPDEYVGIWTIFVPASILSGKNVSYVLIFNNDGTMSAVYSNNLSENDEIQLVPITGKWTVVNGSIIFQADGKDTYGVFLYRDNCLWIDLNEYSFGLKKVSAMDLSQFVYKGE